MYTCFFPVAGAVCKPLDLRSYGIWLLPLLSSRSRRSLQIISVVCLRNTAYTPAFSRNRYSLKNHQRKCPTGYSVYPYLYPVISTSRTSTEGNALRDTAYTSPVSRNFRQLPEKTRISYPLPAPNTFLISFSSTSGHSFLICAKILSLETSGSSP